MPPVFQTDHLNYVPLALLGLTIINVVLKKGLTVIKSRMTKCMNVQGWSKNFIGMYDTPRYYVNTNPPILLKNLKVIYDLDSKGMFL